MYKIIIILLLLQFQPTYSQVLKPIKLKQSKSDQYPYKFGRPTAIGIDQYVNDNKYNFIDEFQSFVKDTILNDVDMTGEDLTDMTDYTGDELGWTEIYNNGYQIIVNNIKEFRDYNIDIKTPKGKSKIKSFIESDQFVKSVIFHELMHVYFHQEMLRITMMRDSTGNSKLNKYYLNVQLVPSAEMRNGSKFIEEGLCEYLIHKKGEVRDYENLYTPKTIEDINAKENKFNVYYKYSYEYLKNFLDSCFVTDGYLRPAIHILLTNNPPNTKEILTPQLYFDRLK
jgi:hypothetical protein